MNQLNTHHLCQHESDWTDCNGNCKDNIEYIIEIVNDDILITEFFLLEYLENGITLENIKYQIVGGNI
jgi:hypothetical protein